MSETIHQPNGLSDSTSMPPSASIAVPPEIESTLSRLSAYRSVRGVMILSRAPPPTSSSTTGSSSAGAAGSTTAQGLGGIVQCTGSIFEEESGQRYATMVEGLVAVAAKGVGERDQGVSSPLHSDSVYCAARLKLIILGRTEDDAYTNETTRIDHNAW